MKTQIIKTITVLRHGFGAPSKKGFAMLFTVLIVSIILSIAIGISNVTFKQNLLSSIAKDSQIAFFAADSGIECGLVNDFAYATLYARGIGPSELTVGGILCGDMSFTLDSSESGMNYLVFKEDVTDGKQPCRTIVFDKTDPVVNKVQSRGYSVCDNTPRQVERALEVKY